MALKVMRRPAAVLRGAGALRRPAAGRDEERGIDRGAVEELEIGTLIFGEEASYFSNACQFSWRIMEEFRDHLGRYCMVKILGMNLESLLTWASGFTYAKVHLCPADCGHDADSLWKISGDEGAGRVGRPSMERCAREGRSERRRRAGSPQRTHGGSTRPSRRRSRSWGKGEEEGGRQRKIQK